MPNPFARPALAAAAVLALAACQGAERSAAETASADSAAPGTAAGATNGPARVAAASDTAAGRYLVIVGGCNDCHTPGWAESDGKLPESDWLTGSSVGYRGPWGTTYAANLRGMASRIDEERWVSILRTADEGEGKPPMPWMNTRQMNEADLRAMYRFIRALGPKGERPPRSVPPGQEPQGQYILMAPQGTAAATTGPGGRTEGQRGAGSARQGAAAGSGTR